MPGMMHARHVQRAFPRVADKRTRRRRFGSGFEIFQWWTRSERIRTASEVALSFSLTEAEAPLYQRLAPEIARLRRLGLSRRRIGTELEIDDKTVDKALRWSEEAGS
jgi:hypothetical protein